MMDRKVLQDYLKFLDPGKLQQNLIRASVFLTCWEMLKDAIVEQPREHFTHNVLSNGRKLKSNYHAAVLSLDPKSDQLRGSARWFKENGALSQDDVVLLFLLKEYRDKIAHELLGFLVNHQNQFDMELLFQLDLLTRKVDKWWIQNIEIPQIEEFDDRELSPEELEDVASGRMITMSLLISVAKGDVAILQGLYDSLKDAFPETL